jgi:uncharacterized heparinase superfamily protein
VIERRVFNLAGALKTVTEAASDAERATLSLSLARQARHLAQLWRPAGRAAEQAAAVGTAGAALSGPAAERLIQRAIARLDEALPRTVLPDGGHASRSPQAALNLLFDLLMFDDALLQLGREPPTELARAIDRLTGALRLFTLPDGKLACFQGGEPVSAAEVSAVRAHDEAEAPAPGQAPHVGYETLLGRSLHCIVDTGAPASGPWRETACAHPLAIEVCAGKDRLITNTGWSPGTDADPALRLTAGGSTAAVAGASTGTLLEGLPARILGPRLHGGPDQVDVRRHQAAEGVWVELAHNGWARRYGVTHERRLFLDVASDELRGEDRFVPRADAGHRDLPYAIHFHLHPDVRASLARDNKSVLLRGPTAGGWWLRNDAREVTIEESVHMQDGQARRSSQVVLRGSIRGERGGRVRWKLGRVEAGES